MRVPIAWLREFVELPPAAQELADRLAMLGFPVEDIEKRPAITGVVAGRIVSLEKHPNADRLQVARIDVAREKPLVVATAAANVAAGQTIAVATIGARLPQLTIEPRTMRGVASQGMMISAEELGLPAEWFEDGILQIEPAIALGSDVAAFFGLNDDVLDVEITSNRADAMSVIGLARELAASYGKPLRLPSFVNPGVRDEPPNEEMRVSLESTDCTRFVAQRFDGITAGPAPAWMRVRLALAGQRPIGKVVDVSNYVMLETGQPLHFYDAARIAEGRLVVRDAVEGEKLVTLDGVERTLSAQALVVADSQRALCLAGLMGAAAGEVNNATTAIVLESANFNGARIRRASKELGLRTEASARHEKTLAPALTDIGAARAAALLTALGATAYAPHAFGADVASPQPLLLDAREVERLLGLPIPAQRIARHLEALGCSVMPAGDAVLSVSPPAWRRDLTAAVDLVEEVARMEGYDNIPPVVPSVPPHGISSARYDLESQIARALAALGYGEIVTHSLHGQQVFERASRAGLKPERGSVEVLNPLSEDQRFLRSSLLPGLVEYFAAVDAPVRAFEIGEVFTAADGGIAERSTAGFGFCAEVVEEPPWRDSHFLRLKGDCEALLHVVTGRRAQAVRGTRDGLHPGKTAALSVDGREVACVGRLDPRLARTHGLRLTAYACIVDLEALPPRRLPHYRPPAKFPSTYRDLALVVDLDVDALRIERTIAGALGTICTGVRVFDEYRGPQVGDERKSVAVRITLQRFDTTITDEDADAAVATVLDAVRRELGATVRS